MEQLSIGFERCRELARHVRVRRTRDWLLLRLLLKALRQVYPNHPNILDVRQHR